MTSRRHFPTHRFSFRLPQNFLFVVSAVGVVAVLGLGGCATTPTSVPELELDFPSPTSGPGQPALDKGASGHIDAGWQALLRGDTAAARSNAAQAGTSAASRLLELQAAIAADKYPVQELEDLTRSAPEYAAAWVTLSAAAEQDSNEAVALRAAERGAALWSNKRWAERPRILRKRWIDDRLEAANTFYEQGNPDAALDSLTPALVLDPDNHDAVLLQARSLIAKNELDHAEAVLARLPRGRDVVLLSGSIAEKRGDSGAAIRIYSSMPEDPEAALRAIALAEEDEDWQTAMQLYSTLPEDQPGKDLGLRKAKLRWRVSVMPGYVQDALSTNELTRSDLAVVIVTLAPIVETLPGGQVPLLSDIVDMPSQKEIITVTKLGLIDVDRLEHRFHPLRPVTGSEVRATVSNLGRLLEIPAPTWCSDDTTGRCVSLTQPITGEQVAGVVIDMVTEEAQ